jgi:hypothetical protein
MIWTYCHTWNCPCTSLTFKICCAILIKHNLDIVGEKNFYKNQSMRTWRSNNRIFELPCWTSTSKNHSPSFHGIHSFNMFKRQSSFWRVFFTMNFFTLKFMKIRWCFFFKSFGYYFWIKLSTLSSIINSLFKTISGIDLTFSRGSSLNIPIPWNLMISLCAHNVFDVMFAWIFSSRQGTGRWASWASLCIFLSERRLGACAWLLCGLGICGGQGHIIWVQWQDAFKEKFGTEIDHEVEKISN